MAQPRYFFGVSDEIWSIFGLELVKVFEFFKKNDFTHITLINVLRIIWTISGFTTPFWKNGTNDLFFESNTLLCKNSIFFNSVIGRAAIRKPILFLSETAKKYGGYGIIGPKYVIFRHSV